MPMWLRGTFNHNGGYYWRYLPGEAGEDTARALLDEWRQNTPLGVVYMLAFVEWGERIPTGAIDKTPSAEDQNRPSLWEKENKRFRFIASGIVHPPFDPPDNERETPGELHCEFRNNGLEFAWWYDEPQPEELSPDDQGHQWLWVPGIKNGAVALVPREYPLDVRSVPVPARCARRVTFPEAPGLRYGDEPNVPNTHTQKVAWAWELGALPQWEAEDTDGPYPCDEVTETPPGDPSLQDVLIDVLIKILLAVAIAALIALIALLAAEAAIGAYLGAMRTAATAAEEVAAVASEEALLAEIEAFIAAMRAEEAGLIAAEELAAQQAIRATAARAAEQAATNLARYQVRF